MSGRLKQLRERLLHLSESLAPPGAYYGEDDPFTFCDAQDREALGVAIGLLDAEIAEREAPPPVLDATDPRLEALRLATAVREYLDRAGLFVDHRAERIASEQACALEQLLATQALGTLAEIPLEVLLAVALDRAMEQAEYGEQLRSAVARSLPAMRLCTPWLDEPGVYERSVRDCATGAQLISISDELEDEGEYEHTYTLRIRGKTQFGLSLSEAERLAAEWLRANGWVQVAEQPESTEPETDERSYAPEETGGIHPDPRDPVWRRP